MSEQNDRALLALRRAVLAAAGRDPGNPLQLNPEEYRGVEGAVIRHELESILMGLYPRAGLQRLHEEGALAALLPEVAALVGFGEGGRRHKDVWEHTKRVVQQSPRRTCIRWAALVHDVGKVPTRRVDADGQVQFHGHAEVGARMVKRLLKRFAFQQEEARIIRLLVLFHQRPSQYEPSWTDSAVRRFSKETEEVLEELLDLSRADMTTKYDDKRRRGQELIDELAERVQAIRVLDAKVPALPKGLGIEIIRRYNLKPGPRVGQLRCAVETAVETGELEPQQEAEIYLAWLDEHIDEL